MSISAHISCNFDSGNIHVIDATDVNNIQLAIKKDHQSDFYQWFHFKLYNQQHVQHTLHIVNAGQSAYVEGWNNYQAVASYDRQQWFRVPTSFDGQTLTITFTPEVDVVYFAYFAPYSQERHLNLIQNVLLNTQSQLTIVGQTLDGRDIEVLQIGEADNNKKTIWLTARQHPGETMAEWFIEGFLERLLDEDDALARTLLDKAVFYIVPNMNPDGSIRGHLRTNAAGVNLNREWLNPSIEKSPEVYFVREKMLTTGVDLFLDVHGDESIPYNFLAGCEGCPSYDKRQDALAQQFKSFLLSLTPEYQTEFGYPVDEPGKANLSLATTWVGEQFKCLSFTLEMPFKDNLNLPDPIYGWSDERSRLFARDFLTAIYHVIDNLRV